MNKQGKFIESLQTILKAKLLAAHQDLYNKQKTYEEKPYWDGDIEKEKETIIGLKGQIDAYTDCLATIDYLIDKEKEDNDKR